MVAKKTIKVSAGDWYFDVNGQSKYIIEDEKVAQDVADFILKQPGIEGATDINTVRIFVSEAIEKLKQSQQLTPDISKREEIDQIIDIKALRNPEDITEGFFFIAVLTRAGDIVTRIFDKDTFTDLSHLLPEEFKDTVDKLTFFNP